MTPSCMTEICSRGIPLKLQKHGECEDVVLSARSLTGMPSLSIILAGSAIAVSCAVAACPGYEPIQPVFTGGIK